MKKIFVFAIALIALLALSNMALAVDDLTVDWVKIDGDLVTEDEQLVVERGDDLTIKVKLKNGNQSLEDVEVEARILGYEYSDHDDSLRDSTHVFDMVAFDARTETLNLDLPVKADKAFYDLRVRVGTRTGVSDEYLFRLNLDGNRHSVEIRDVLMHPRVVEAGSSLLVNVRVTNRGEEEEEDVKVTAKIDDLNLEDSDYIGELEEDESQTSEELFMRIPACTAPGIYEVEIDVEYDEGYETVTSTETVEVVDGRFCGNEAEESVDADSIISVGSQSQQVVAGKGGATYSLAVTNPASTDRTYTVSVSGVEAWGTYRVDPATTVIVKSGETKPVFVYVAANDNAMEGQQSFVVTVAADGETQPVQFNTAVVKDSNNLRKWAEVVLIALVVLLIVLGLIIGFSRMRGRDDMGDDEELSGQTYY